MLVVEKSLASVGILTVTCLSGLLPLTRWKTNTSAKNNRSLEALASGIFLGAGLIHMLPEASSAPHPYPWPYVATGSVFLFLLWLEHISRELQAHQPDHHQRAVAWLTTLMLSVHSLLAGLALGLSDDAPTMLMVLVAILSHKWATSFALAVQLMRAQWQKARTLLIFSVYASMVPLGIVVGMHTVHWVGGNAHWVSLFHACSAGTFLYIGTLHGLNRAVMIEHCCNLRQFAWMVMGFLLMAGMAAWH